MLMSSGWETSHCVSRQAPKPERSSWRFSGFFPAPKNCSDSGCRAVKASRSSRPTSKFGWRREGPSAARIRLGSAPWRTIRSTVFSSTPARAPRHPAWAAAAIPASGSASSHGMQSAANTPSARPGVFVTSASASAGASSQGASINTAFGE